ncbi:Nucleosome assembly protein family [Zostera marina]|uniref:Nucleosome assembly protein family n=1 Tax=Zostera marina TaxID=29655 RepID=A0A0K9PWM3_ZOSMR|nr:Nucleosome assembly protein family [Zostera marina]
MGADKGKKAKIVEGGEEEDGTKLFPFVEKLQEIQDDLEKINEDASDKVLELEQQFNEIRRPVYNKRTEVINSIPDFWLTAFLSHPVLSDILNDEDQKLFKHLVSLDVEDFKDVKSGYTITFKFSENPFFEDSELIKTFNFSDDGATNITCTPIKWKEGAYLQEITNGDVPNTNSKKRPFSEDSFFTWFSESNQKNPLGPADTIFDEVAEVIKEDLWPNPLKYFNNEVDEEDFDGEDDEDKESDDDEDDEDEQEDEEDES